MMSSSPPLSPLFGIALLPNVSSFFFSEPSSHFSEHSLSRHPSSAFRHRSPAPPFLSASFGQIGSNEGPLFGSVWPNREPPFGQIGPNEGPCFGSVWPNNVEREESAEGRRGPVPESRGYRMRCVREWRKGARKGRRKRRWKEEGRCRKGGRKQCRKGNGKKMKPGGALLGRAASKGEREDRDALEGDGRGRRRGKGRCEEKRGG